MRRVLSSLVVAGVAAGSLTACVEFKQESFTEERTVDVPVTAVRLQNGSGDVRIVRSADAPATTVTRTVTHPPRDDRPSGDSHRVEGGTLVLDGCGDRCSVDYRVVVPGEGVRAYGQVDSGDVVLEGLGDVELDAGSGDVRVGDISGRVYVDSGSGVVAGRDVAGDFVAEVGSGDVDVAEVGGNTVLTVSSGTVRARRMGGEVQVDAGSGDVELELLTARSVRAHADSGNLRVRVPAGAYRVSADADSGNADASAVRNSADAEHELRLRTGSGDIVVTVAAA
ncbi:DUF4097 family beta strand repeat-containing protein [Umezawaea beigongshangensis]|uniref:DUF4097 family beta strand repeat-containing protein n=1 Tax=Umezawaea beigongshangensis TaxID=2780383 RepID=UPI0018F14CAE|nr:DUF4097 family beta strand repeat-containing protein [Umezawaea beigongshangensis]